MRALLALWFAVALWLLPAAALRHAGRDALRPRVSAELTAHYLAARAEQSADTIRLPQPRSAGVGPGASALLQEAAPPLACALVARRDAALPRTAAREARPRRARFRYEATAPPQALS